MALPQPELLVYLHKSPSHLKQKIISRGRDYEQNISLDYLAGIQDSYMQYIQQASLPRVIIIDTSGIDFVHSKTDYNTIIEIITSEYPEGIHTINP